MVIEAFGHTDNLFSSRPYACRKAETISVREACQPGAIPARMPTATATRTPWIGGWHCSKVKILSATGSASVFCNMLVFCNYCDSPGSLVQPVAHPRNFFVLVPHKYVRTFLARSAHFSRMLFRFL